MSAHSQVKYFEKQKDDLCAVHAINNLLGERKVEPKDLGPRE